jgi:hypothetical protein
MKIAKNLMLRLFGAVVLFFFCTGTGYVYRTWECRSDLETIYVAAPGYKARDGILPRRLYEMKVTRCTLPEQWGGQREPLTGFP